MPVYRTRRNPALVGERFRRGRGYYGGTDPWAPLSEQQLRRRAQRDVGMSIAPLIKQINARAGAGAQNLEGVYGRLATDLGGYQQRQADIYGRARQSLEGADRALAASLGGAGGGIQTGLQSSLAAAGLQVPGDIGVQGALGVQSARGRGELGELALRQAAAEDFAAKLPGFARLAGAQGIRELQAQRARDVSDLSAKAQASLLDLLQSGRKEEFDKAVARLGFQGDVYQEQQQTERTKIQQSGQNARTAAQIEAQNERTRATINAQAARQGREYNESLSRSAGHAVDAKGRPIVNPRTGKPYPYVPTKKGKGSAPKRSFNENLSAQVGHLVDNEGHAYTDRHGRWIPYKPGLRPGGKSKGSSSKGSTSGSDSPSGLGP